MKRFVFRLASVLRLRRFELERLRGEHARLEAEHRRRAARLGEELARVERGRALLREETRAGAAADRLALRADGIATGRLRVAHAETQVRELDEPRAEALRRLRHAHARVRSLERLEEKASTAHRLAEQAAEQTALEELARSRRSRAGLGRVAGLVIGLGLAVAAGPLRAQDGSERPAQDGSEERSEAGASIVDAERLKEGRSPVDLLNAPGLSRGVDAIIAEIRKREIALALREQRVAERERAVAELETRIDDRAIGLDRIREEIENRIARWSSLGEDRVQQLANVYSAMPPGKAGRLLDRLELDLSVEVVRHMKKKSSAAVLGAMGSERALMISRRMLKPLDPTTDAQAAPAASGGR